MNVLRRLTDYMHQNKSVPSSSFELRRSVRRLFLLRHDKKLAPFRFVQQSNEHSIIIKEDIDLIQFIEKFQTI